MIVSESYIFVKGYHHSRTFFRESEKVADSRTFSFADYSRYTVYRRDRNYLRHVHKTVVAPSADNDDNGNKSTVQSEQSEQAQESAEPGTDTKLQELFRTSHSRIVIDS